MWRGLTKTPVRKSRRRGCGALALLGLVGWTAGCGAPPAISADVAASIDGEEIHYRQFESYLREQGDEELALQGIVQSRLFDQFLDEQLLIRLAIERGLVERDAEGRDPASHDPDQAPADAGVDQRRAVSFLLRGSLRQDWPREQVEAYYQAHLMDFRRPEEIHLRQILVHEREQAEQALRELDAGQDFAQVAARFSQGPKAHLGGDQGRLGLEDLPSEFNEEVFALPAGEFSEILEADYGFLIFQVLERFAAVSYGLDEVWTEIEQSLRRQQIDEMVAGFIEEAKGRYNVVVFPNNFPFEYRGSYAQ